MPLSRRRLFQTAALAGAAPLAAQTPLLPDGRLLRLAPVLAQRAPQLEALRSFVIEDRIAPTQGVLDADG